jgi:hypothetical protein
MMTTAGAMLNMLHPVEAQSVPFRAAVVAPVFPMLSFARDSVHFGGARTPA